MPHTRVNSNFTRIYISYFFATKQTEEIHKNNQAWQAVISQRLSLTASENNKTHFWLAMHFSLRTVRRTKKTMSLKLLKFTMYVCHHICNGCLVIDLAKWRNAFLLPRKFCGTFKQICLKSSDKNIILCEQIMWFIIFLLLAMRKIII